MVFSARTDLAIEASAMLSRKPGGKIDGVDVENYEQNGVSVTKVKIIDENGEAAIGKPVGNYITIECEEIRSGDEEAFKETQAVLTKELKSIAKINDALQYTALNFFMNLFMSAPVTVLFFQFIHNHGRNFITALAFTKGFI